MYKAAKQNIDTTSYESSATAITDLMKPDSDLKKVEFRVTSREVGLAKVHGFSKTNGRTKDVFEVPLYEAELIAEGKSPRKFKVIRFGVLQEKTGGEATVVGRQDQQSHTCKAWHEGYNDIGEDDQQSGGWSIVSTTKIIDGMNDVSKEIGEAYGHIEVCGENSEKKGEFGALKFLIKDWTGANEATGGGQEAYETIVKNELLKITLDKVDKPKLKKVNSGGNGNVMIKESCSLFEITDKTTGYTFSKVYGESDVSGNFKKIIVPTYEMVLYDYDARTGKSKKIASFDVTRDGWFNQGARYVNGALRYHLVNRTSEPDQEKIVLNLTGTDGYAHDTYGAYGMDSFEAIDTPESWYEYEDGTEVGDKIVRSDKGTAKEVMIHVGGYFQNNDEKYALAGTYGCFGVVHPKQVFQKYNEAEAQSNEFAKIKDGGNALNKLSYPTSNSEMKRLVNIIPRTKVKVRIIRRDPSTYETENFIK